MITFELGDFTVKGEDENSVITLVTITFTAIILLKILPELIILFNK